MDDIRRLTVVIRIINECEVTWWPDHGTLLGLVRERRLLPWDKDIDLSIFAKDLGCVCRAIEEKKSALDAHVVCTSRNLKIIPYGGAGRVIDISSYFFESEVSLKKYLVMFPRGDQLRFGALRRFFWRLCRKNEAVIKRFRFISDWTVTRNNLGSMQFKIFCWVTRLRECFGVKVVSRVPVRFFQRWEQIFWRGLEFKAPEFPEKYLAYRYGLDWNVPKKDWKWWQDDFSI